jgi:hypothetical protein
MTLFVTGGAGFIGSNFVLGGQGCEHVELMSPGSTFQETLRVPSH